MSDLYKEHIDITNEVKESIQKLNIVFPAEYNRIYSEKARSHQVELKPDQVLSSEMLDEKMVRHLITLAKCTDEAIGAIEHEDKKLLEIIYQETKQLQEEIHDLQKIVYEDGLTKSYNRKWFEDTLCNTDHISIRDSGTLVMVDLNKFKHINDTYGHIVGDKVLIHIALKLKETGGRVVRYGGDEFVIIFDSKISTDEITAKMEAILNYCKKTHFKLEENSFKINFSYGMALFIKGANIDTIIEKADKAMYHNKVSKK
ncbi:MAG: GGDEF domain-containing protein [Sulfuricurvum sp.]|uniref:GGDEF domain-containing protein n=1 Tax=Sulfuricurvum sp. TaxID=2025608 RepID=UPI0025F11704|nr:GGDEF domain-containing protein [Sulfuricurvum sp.]MBV5320548.1 GGDEF domain-containing protein [Sulfuricurvum sp.]